jgi:hypothetical protein
MGLGRKKILHYSLAGILIYFIGVSLVGKFLFNMMVIFFLTMASGFK